MAKLDLDRGHCQHLGLQTYECMLLVALTGLKALELSSNL